MRLMKYLISLFAIAAVLFMAIVPVAASPSDAPLSQANLLSNPGFETFSGGTATNWAVWSVPGDGCGRSAPTAQQATKTLDGRRVREGSSAQQLMTPVDGIGRTFLAGVQQTVGVTAGRKYKFTVWAQMWSSVADNAGSSEGAGPANFQIGIGQGATYAADPGVTRSGLSDFRDNYGQLSVEAVATGGQITVFIYANPQNCNKHTEVFFDDASLIEVGSSPTSAPNVPAPTAGPTSPPARSLVGKLPIPTPNAEGKVIFTMPADVTIIDICFSLDRGNDPKCIDDIMKMNGLSSAKFISVGQKLIIATVAPSGGSQPAATTAPQPTAAQPQATGAQPQPTAGGGAQPTKSAATSQPQVTGTKQAGGGQICFTLYNDANGNGVLDAGEGLVKGGTFNLLDTTNSSTVATYTTDGVSEPKCFDNLKPGSYRVSSTAPQGYSSTTKADWDLTLTAGGNATLEFGAQSKGGAATPTTGTTGDNSAITRALLAGAGVVLLLIAAGVAGFLVLTRRR